MVLSSRNSLRTMTVFLGRRHLGHWMYFVWALWEMTLVCWRLRGRPNFQDLLVLGHSNRGWLAGHFPSSWVQILISKIQKGQSILSDQEHAKWGHRSSLAAHNLRSYSKNHLNWRSQTPILQYIINNQIFINVTRIIEWTLGLRALRNCRKQPAGFLQALWFLSIMFKSWWIKKIYQF